MTRPVLDFKLSNTFEECPNAHECSERIDVCQMELGPSLLTSGTTPKTTVFKGPEDVLYNIFRTRGKANC